LRGSLCRARNAKAAHARCKVRGSALRTAPVFCGRARGIKSPAHDRICTFRLIAHVPNCESETIRRMRAPRCVTLRYRIALTCVSDAHTHARHAEIAKRLYSRHLHSAITRTVCESANFASLRMPHNCVVHSAVGCVWHSTAKPNANRISQAACAHDVVKRNDRASEEAHLISQHFYEAQSGLQSVMNQWCLGTRRRRSRVRISRIHCHVLIGERAESDVDTFKALAVRRYLICLILRNVLFVAGRIRAYADVYTYIMYTYGTWCRVGKTLHNYVEVTKKKGKVAKRYKKPPRW
jgi:hypothetical protein